MGFSKVFVLVYTFKCHDWVLHLSLNSNFAILKSTTLCSYLQSTYVLLSTENNRLYTCQLLAIFAMCYLLTIATFSVYIVHGNVCFPFFPVLLWFFLILKELLLSWSSVNKAKRFILMINSNKSKLKRWLRLR